MPGFCGVESNALLICLLALNDSDYVLGYRHWTAIQKNWQQSMSVQQHTSGDWSLSEDSDLSRLRRWWPLDLPWAISSPSLRPSSSEDSLHSRRCFLCLGLSELPLGKSFRSSENRPLFLTRVGDSSITSSLAEFPSKDMWMAPPVNCRHYFYNINCRDDMQSKKARVFCQGFYRLL